MFSSSLTFITVLGSIVSSFGATDTTPVTQNTTSLTEVGKWFSEIETWRASAEMVADLPFYQSGYDYDGRPVYVTEYGKWNVSKYLDSGNPEDIDNLYRRTQKLWYDAINTPSPKEEAEEGLVAILDINGFQPKQLLSTEVIKFQLWNMRVMEFIDKYINEIYFVNVNFVGTQWVNLIRPVAGAVVGRAHILGPQKERISSTLRQKIPKDQLPPWLGGNKSWKPVLIQ